MSNPYKGQLREVQLTIQGAKGPVVYEQWNGMAWVPLKRITVEMSNDDT